MSLNQEKNDSISVRGRFDNTINVAAGGLTIFNLDPQNTYSTRLNNIAQFYQKYRIVQLVVKFNPTQPANTTSTPVLAFGIDEDINSVSPPTTTAAVSAFRCSATISGLDADPTDMLTYYPSDRKRWYYTKDDGIDGRFLTQATLYFANPLSVAATGIVQVCYSYTFCQSAGNGSFDLSDPLYQPLTVTVYGPQRDNSADEPIVVRTPRPPPPISTGSAPKGYFSR
jgi:hypothetical protein